MGTIELGTILIVDRSAIGRAIVARYMKPYADRTIEAASSTEARKVLDATDLSLIVIDLADDDAFGLLDEVSRRARKPAILALAARPDRDEETRVLLRGAIGYLEKPVSLHEILRSLRSAREPFVPTSPRTRTEPMAYAIVVDADAESEELRWDVWNMSVEGALVGSGCFIPTGTRLELILQLGRTEVRVGAEVVRAQEPSWTSMAGVGIKFQFASETDRRTVERFLAKAPDGRT